MATSDPLQTQSTFRAQNANEPASSIVDLSVRQWQATMTCHATDSDKPQWLVMPQTVTSHNDLSCVRQWQATMTCHATDSDKPQWLAMPQRLYPQCSHSQFTLNSLTIFLAHDRKKGGKWNRYSLKQNEAQSACAESTNKGVNSLSDDVTLTQQRPTSPTVTPTWHGSTCIHGTWYSSAIIPPSGHTQFKYPPFQAHSVRVTVGDSLCSCKIFRARVDSLVCWC